MAEGDYIKYMKESVDINLQARTRNIGKCQHYNCGSFVFVTFTRNMAMEGKHSFHTLVIVLVLIVSDSHPLPSDGCGKVLRKF